MIPITARRISGADEPNAMSVRFATVLFQTGTSITSLGESLSGLAMWISVVLLVIFSIAHMKMSEMIEIPKKLEIYLLTDTCLTSSLEDG